jgi:glycerophosphoryl diester phosphodiesterase
MSPWEAVLRRYYSGLDNALVEELVTLPWRDRSRLLTTQVFGSEPKVFAVKAISMCEEVLILTGRVADEIVATPDPTDDLWELLEVMTTLNLRASDTRQGLLEHPARASSDVVDSIERLLTHVRDVCRELNISTQVDLPEVPPELILNIVTFPGPAPRPAADYGLSRKDRQKIATDFNQELTPQARQEAMKRLEEEWKEAQRKLREARDSSAEDAVVKRLTQATITAHERLMFAAFMAHAASFSDVARSTFANFEELAADCDAIKVPSELSQPPAKAPKRMNVLTTIAASYQNVQIVAHRGLGGADLENTLPGFRHAIKLGCAMAECDVHLSSDGEVVVIHDSTVDRTTSLSGNVSDFTASELAREGVPTLASLLEITRDRIPLAIELKGGEGVEAKVVELLEARAMTNQVVIFCFDRQRLRLIKKLRPTLYTVWLVGQELEHSELFEKLNEMRAGALGVPYTWCSAELVTAAHEKGLPVFVWTVPPEEACRIADMGANFLITDWPYELMALLRRS